jgi:hypothetical protein
MNIIKDAKAWIRENMVIADPWTKELAAERGHRMRYFLPNRGPVYTDMKS